MHGSYTVMVHTYRTCRFITVHGRLHRISHPISLSFPQKETLAKNYERKSKGHFSLISSGIKCEKRYHALSHGVRSPARSIPWILPLPREDSTRSPTLSSYSYSYSFLSLSILLWFPFRFLSWRTFFFHFSIFLVSLNANRSKLLPLSYGTNLWLTSFSVFINVAGPLLHRRGYCGHWSYSS